MPGQNPVQQAQALTETLKQMEKGYGQVDNRVQTFCQSGEQQLQQLAASLQKLEKEEQSFEANLDQTLKQLEQEVSQSQGFLAALAPGNKVAQREQVSQKRMALLNAGKKLRQTLQEASQELGLTLRQFQEGTRQLHNDFNPLRQEFQSLSETLDQLHNELQSLQQQSTTPLPSQQAATQTPAQGVQAQTSPSQVPGNTSAASGSSQEMGQGLGWREQMTLASLQEAMQALYQAQHLYQQSRVLQGLLQSLDRNLMARERGQ